MISQRFVVFDTRSPSAALTAAAVELVSEGGKAKEAKKRFDEDASSDLVDAATA